MITTAERAPILLRVAAPLAWRSPRAIQTKLLGFAATEWGSALDMLRAAELTDDPRHRRLFLRHALDEARHADLFTEAAARIRARSVSAGAAGHDRDRIGRAPAPARSHLRAVPALRRLRFGSGARPAVAVVRSHEAAHADRQDLYERLGSLPFLVFVQRSESRALRQFETLARHFHDDDVLRPLFETIARDERFHATYSGRLLEDAAAEGQGAAVAKARRYVRWWQARTAWMSAGKRVMDKVVGVTLAALFFAAVGPFALIAALLGKRRAPAGWTALAPAPTSIEALERQA